MEKNLVKGQNQYKAISARNVFFTDIPTTPVGPVEFSDIQKTSATISWKPSRSNGGSPITHYVVEKREKSLRSWTEAATIRTDGQQLNKLSADLANLKEGQEYLIQVKAVNSVGMSKPLEAPKALKPKSPYGKICNYENLLSENFTFYTEVHLYTLKHSLDHRGVTVAVCRSVHRSVSSFFVNSISLGECSNILSAYTKYRHLGWYCTHPSISSKLIGQFQ